MTQDPFVFRVRTRLWVQLSFWFIVLYAIWFGVAVVAEQLEWSDEVGVWLGLTTQAWGLIGLGLMILAAIYYVLLLTRREVPSQSYPLAAPPPEVQPLQSAEGATPAETTPAESLPPEGT